MQSDGCTLFAHSSRFPRYLLGAICTLNPCHNKLEFIVKSDHVHGSGKQRPHRTNSPTVTPTSLGRCEFPLVKNAITVLIAARFGSSVCLPKHQAARKMCTEPKMHLCNDCLLESSAVPHRCSLPPDAEGQTQPHWHSRKPMPCSTEICEARHNGLRRMVCMLTR